MEIESAKAKQIYHISIWRYDEITKQIVHKTK